MEIDLIRYYKMAFNGFKKCISNDENMFLKNEVDFELDQLKTKDEKVLFEFSNLNSKDYIVEIVIGIFDPDLRNKIGSYHFYTNQNNERVDDKLVW